MPTPDWLSDPMNYEVRTYDPPLQWDVRLGNSMSHGGPVSAAVTALEEVLEAEPDLHVVEIRATSEELPQATAKVLVVAATWYELSERFDALSAQLEARTRELLDPASRGGRSMWTGGVEIYPADPAQAGPDAYERAKA